MRVGVSMASLRAVGAGDVFCDFELRRSATGDASAVVRDGSAVSGSSNKKYKCTKAHIMVLKESWYVLVSALADCRISMLTHSQPRYALPRLTAAPQ